MTITNDVFRVFISHKHEDHALAVVVKKAIESLNKDLIECFVSGVDITAGRTGGARSAARSREAIFSCCCSPHRRRTGTGASSRRACTRDSTEARSGQSSACSTPSTPRQARSPTFRACQPMPRRSSRFWIRCAAGRGRFPTTGAEGADARHHVQQVEGRGWRHRRRVRPLRGRPRRTTRAIASYYRCPSPMTSPKESPKVPRWYWVPTAPRVTRCRCSTWPAEATAHMG